MFCMFLFARFRCFRTNDPLQIMGRGVVKEILYDSMLWEEGWEENCPWMQFCLK